MVADFRGLREPFQDTSLRYLVSLCTPRTSAALPLINRSGCPYILVLFMQKGKAEVQHISRPNDIKGVEVKMSYYP